MGVVEVPDPRSARRAGKYIEPGVGLSAFRGICPRFAKGKLMAIVLISESLLLRSTVADGSLLRDRLLAGFCVRMNARKRTFRIATSVAGEQFRMNLGYWPLMSVEDARARAMVVLAQCRRGERPKGYVPKAYVPKAVPTLRTAYLAYCSAKKIKLSSQNRYESFFRAHFGTWLDRPVSDLSTPEFADHCHAFSQTKGAALVEFGRGVIGALIKYTNAVYDLAMISPFTKLATVGLMPDRAQPRARLLQESQLPAWKRAVDALGERQRDFLYLTLYTGLRRNECRELRRDQIDLLAGVLRVPETKNGKPHTLPITTAMREILERRCAGLQPAQELFEGVAAGHLSKMAARAGSPAFMLHDLRKLVATTGERLGLGDAVLRRILNHTPPKSDVLHRHYVSLGVEDIREPLGLIQVELGRLGSL